MTTINEQQNTLYSDLGLNRQESIDNGRKETLDQSDFLALLTTQLATQDPFDPMDNKEFISQMAEFSALSGQEQLNENFGALAQSLTSSQALQASALVGRSVMVPTSVGYLQGEGNIEGRVSLPQRTENVWVEVTNQTGQVVSRFEMGTYSAGDLEIAWDGLNESGERMPEGSYSLAVYGQMNGVTEQFGTQMRAQVNSVNLAGSDGNIVLNLTGLGSVNLSDIEEIGI